MKYKTKKKTVQMQCINQFYLNLFEFHIPSISTILFQSHGLLFFLLIAMNLLCFLFKCNIRFLVQKLTTVDSQKS